MTAVSKPETVGLLETVGGRLCRFQQFSPPRPKKPEPPLPAYIDTLTILFIPYVRRLRAETVGQSNSSTVSRATATKSDREALP